MTAVGAQIAFYALLRSSEYVPDYVGSGLNCCHALLARDVWFEVEHEGQLSMFDASEVSPQMWPFVKLVRFTLRSAKNDKMRMGSVFWYKNIPDNTTLGINIVKVAFDWALKARLGPEDFFLSRRSGNSGSMIALKYRQVSEAVKKCAARFGFSADNYGTHSLRVGGACTLRAGGASDSMLKLLGRWQCLKSALGYTESGMREFDSCYQMLCNPANFTERDVRLLHDKVRGNRNSLRPDSVLRFSRDGRTVHFAA